MVGAASNRKPLIVAPIAHDAGHDPSSESDALLTASRALLGVVARSLAPALEQVTLPQFRVLVVLSVAPRPVRSGDLAAAIGVHRSTFSRTADRMVAGGWIRRVDNPDSRRETMIVLTTKGARLVALVTKRRRTEINTILRRMNPPDREVARQGLEAFARACGEATAGELATLGM